ncbi:MAG TPA: amino acid permease [Anaeromyxobacteraceae bacterium]|nr:amino acid permease [Anaeromyxobacteraceae bacterium]
MNAKTRNLLGLWPGVGLVAANMIGAGVFLSAGFMAQAMGPGPILLAWVVGAVLAMAGAKAYSAVAALVPRSGGEYRYLSELLHPAVGYLSGWASLLVGFSAPVAADALAAGEFARTVFPGLAAQWTVSLAGHHFTVRAVQLAAAGLVAALTALHVAGLETSARTQNALVVIKAILLAGFVAVGLALGSGAWPAWHPPSAGSGFPLSAFVFNLLFVMFAYSGWNAVVYAAEEFHVPERTVPRAMLLGCALVALLYFAVNWIFVANLTPEQAGIVTAYGNPEQEQVTLAHAVMRQLIGPGTARVMSVFTVAVFLSAMSAMIFVGPRVYAAMARDGFLPRALDAREGRPPVGAIVLQGALSVVIVFTQSLRDILANVSAILILFSALTALGLFRVALAPRGRPRPAAAALAAAGVYVAASAWMLWRGFSGSAWLLPWVAAIAAFGVGAYLLSPGRRRAAGAAGAAAVPGEGPPSPAS